MAWGLTWATIRERAKMVLEGYLNDREAEDSFPIPKLTLEIDIEDGQDLFDEISDTEY
jgi:predicted RNase H-like HicB family nuclease